MVGMKISSDKEYFSLRLWARVSVRVFSAVCLSSRLVLASMKKRRLEIGEFGDSKTNLSQ